MRPLYCQLCVTKRHHKLSPNTFNPTVLLFHVSQLLCPFLTSPATLHRLLHHLKRHRAPDVCCCVQWWMWHRWLSPGTEDPGYSPPSASLSSTPPSLYIWRWNMRITTPTAVCSAIPSATRLDISTFLSSVTQPLVLVSTEDYLFPSCVSIGPQRQLKSDPNTTHFFQWPLLNKYWFSVLNPDTLL